MRPLPFQVALLLAAAGCAQAPPPAEPVPADPGPVEAAHPPDPAPAPDRLGPKILAEADRLFTEASRARAAARPDDAASLYGASLALYDALEKFEPSAALKIRAANAREGQAKAAAEAETAAKARYRDEFLATMPPAPFPNDASVIGHFEELVARNPDDRTARRRLAALYLADERYPEAAAALEPGADPEPVLDLAKAALWYRLGRNEDAVKKLEEVRLKWRKALPPRIVRPAFCLAPPKGFDRFTPAERAEFFPQQKVWVYFEVANATCAAIEGGKYKVSLKCDYEILDESGKSVPWPEVADFSRDYDPPAYGTPVNDICLQLGLVLPRLARGKYTLLLRLTDKSENKTGEERLTFEVK